MKEPTELVSFVIGVISIAVLAIVGWWLLSGFFNYVLGLDKVVASAIIAALVAVFSALFTFWKERSKSLHEAYRGKKIEVYSLFFDLVSKVVKNSDNDSMLTIGIPRKNSKISSMIWHVELFSMGLQRSLGL